MAHVLKLKDAHGRFVLVGHDLSGQLFSVSFNGGSSPHPGPARGNRWQAADTATLVAAACYGAAMLVVAVGVFLR